MFLLAAIAHYLVEAGSGLPVLAWIAIGTAALLLGAGVGVVLLGMRRPGPPRSTGDPPPAPRHAAHAGHGRHRA